MNSLAGAVVFKSILLGRIEVCSSRDHPHIFLLDQILLMKASLHWHSVGISIWRILEQSMHRIKATLEILLLIVDFLGELRTVDLVLISD